ncbi:MAG TPA: hypothetical protein VE621_13725 [Bryobacteraceae bacterium]|jgi:hypothetical protein|nr:hypothetical protein [Bryobacteraceae bacterium]
MQFSKAAANFYLDYLTFHPFAGDDEGLESLSELDRYIRDMKIVAEQHGDLEPLRIFFDSVLANPEFATTSLLGSNWAFPEEELRRMIAYAREKVWPGVPRSPDPQFELADVALEDWWASRE